MTRRLKNDALKDLLPKQRESVSVKIKDKDFQDKWTKSHEKCKELKFQEGGEATNMSDENEDDDINEEENSNLGYRLTDTSRTSRMKNSHMKKFLPQC